jgi:hypothetical protein
MSAVLLGVFKDHETAERLLVGLVRDGFPTDRVELTCRHSPGRAGVVPAETFRHKLVRYYNSLLKADHQRAMGEKLASRVEDGAATVTVHPRGRVEAARAFHLLNAAGPEEVAEHDMPRHAMERAAARNAASRNKDAWSLLGRLRRPGFNRVEATRSV